jgi:hypothetical protein
MPSVVAPNLSDAQLAELIDLTRGADSVELKLTVPESYQRSAISALDMDPMDAQIRQVFFFDTPDLALNKAGVVARARRVQGKGDDTVVKLRPVVPADMPEALRQSEAFVVEVDAMPGGFVCSGSLKGTPGNGAVKDAVQGGRPIRKLFSKEQRDFFKAHAPEGLKLDDLEVMGPVFVLKLKFSPKQFGRKLVAEVWLYPDDTRILELSTKCTPTDAFNVAAQARVFLGERGVDLSGEQQTKTATALKFFSKKLADAKKTAATAA